jgi:acyl carrier protein
MASQYAEKIRHIVVQHGRLAVPAERLAEDTDLYKAGLTSLATVGLMLALEEQFNIEFTDGMLGRQTFGSIGSIAQAVAKLVPK